LTTEPNTSNILTPHDVDMVINRLNGTIERNLSKLFIMSLPKKYKNDIIVGGLMNFESHSQVISNTTRQELINSNVSAAIIFSDDSLNNINAINVFILGNSTAYKNLYSSKNQFIVSSVITASVKKENESLINITLFFQVLYRDQSHNNDVNENYLCSYLDTNTSQWKQSGCYDTQYNELYDRYECTCDHLTSFALIWLPKTSQPNYLTAQNIASLIFQSISIISFIAVIIHSLVSRLINPFMTLGARDLLPLISSASTTILFIFYIALTMTVYIRTTSESGTKCFLSSSVLMFFVYFFLIFMFCIKTSIGYFNYLRFVHLFPEPSYRKLVILLMISFFIAITSTSFAAGFNSNSSYNITQLHENKICWFTRDVIYYFMTIPVCIFLLLNFITIIFVAKHIINHVRRATSSHQSYERMKRCVLVLLSSCVTQGIGWLFGPFISFINPTAGEVVGWFFVIFVGLEGVWTILLYIIIRSQHMDEQLRITAYKKLIKTSALSSIKREKEYSSDLNSKLTRRFQNTHRNNRRKQSVFNDLPDVYYINWQTNSSYV
jgi:hypothetical protein